MKASDTPESLATEPRAPEVKAARGLIKASSFRRQMKNENGSSLLEKYNAALSRPWVTAYRLLGDRIARYLPLFEDLRPNLLRSGRKISFEAYVSLTFFTAIIGFGAGFMLTFALTLALGAALLGALILAAGIGLLGGALGFVVTYGYPSLAADGRKRQLDEDLPFSISQMAILSSAGLPPERIFRSVAELETSSVLSDEARTIIRDVDLLGFDMLTAMQRARERSPSKYFADFLEGFIATTRSGGDLKKYLLSSAKDLMETRRILGKQLVDTLGMVAESYVSMLVVFPLILLIMFSVMGLVGGTIGGFSVFTVMALVTYVLVPLLAIAVIVLLDAMIPKR